MKIELERMQHELGELPALLEAAKTAAANVSHEVLLHAEAGLLDLEEALEGQEHLFELEGPEHLFEHELEIEAEDESVSAGTIEQLTNEAVRQAQETLHALAELAVVGSW
jgi:hypothetical protein